MERMAGRPLIATGLLGMTRVLAELQLRLHGLDPSPLAKALGEAATFDGYLAALTRRIDHARLDGLASVIGWLRARRPRADGAPAICHGDLHPQNILVEGRVATGVLDWPNVLVADPAFDVASTLNILRFAPAGLASVPPALRRLVHIAQPVLARRYLARYCRGRRIEPARLGYYEVAAALRALVRAGETHQRSAPVTELDASPYAARLLGRVREITGIHAVIEQTP
jgi:aminoglycoside phosphotransferase (APT) family kinase protein